MEYSFEHCLKAAKSNGSLEALAANEPLIFDQVYACGWVTEAQNYILYRGKYKIENIFEIARRYSHISEWRFAKYNSYRFAQSRKWHYHCGITLGVVRKHNRYSDKELLMLAKTFLDVNDLHRKHPDAYDYIRRRRLKNKAFAHMEVGVLSIEIRYTIEQCIVSALRCNNKTTWKRESPDYYKVSYSNGWLATVSRSVGWKVSLTSELKMRILKSASQYQYKSDWLTAENSLYALAKHHSLFAIATWHMVDKPPAKKKPRCRFDKALCIEAAKRYSKRTEFARAERNLYEAALKRGLLDEVCLHMTNASKVT